jgi:hypothetical protein
MSIAHDRGRTTQVSARVDPETLAVVERIAETERRPVAQVVRNILIDFAAAHAAQQGARAA